MKRVFIWTVLLTILLTSTIWSATVEVSWNANTESDLKGYELYQSFTSDLPGIATANILAPNTTYLAIGLPDGIVYFWLLAYDMNDNKSEIAGPVSLTISEPPAKPSGLKAVIKN